MYVTLSEIKTYLWDWQMSDANAQYLYDSATNILHTACRVDTFEAVEKTENVKYSYDNIYYLRCNVRSIVSIGWVAVTSDDYFLNWRRVTTDISYSSDKRGNVAIVYNAWYDPLPWDIKACVLSLCGYVQTHGKAQGISSYTQGDISITYNTQDSDQMSILKGIVSKYWFVEVYSN